MTAEAVTCSGIRVPYVGTRPLGFQHTLSDCWVLKPAVIPGKNSPCVDTMVVPQHGVPQGDVYSGNLQDLPDLGAK